MFCIRTYVCVTYMSCRVAFLPMQALRKHCHIDGHASVALFGGLILCAIQFQQYDFSWQYVRICSDPSVGIACSDVQYSSVHFSTKPNARFKSTGPILQTEFSWLTCTGRRPGYIGCEIIVQYPRGILAKWSIVMRACTYLTSERTESENKTWTRSGVRGQPTFKQLIVCISLTY